MCVWLLCKCAHLCVSVSMAAVGQASGDPAGGLAGLSVAAQSE